jgi:dihydroflavonol-4-reductase
VARGHLLAAERGRCGTRYILAGENRTMREFAACLAEVGGMASRRRLSLPSVVQTALACLAECRAALVNREPYPSLQYARLSRFRWYYSSQRAQTELGYSARPMRDSLADAHRWLCTNGWLKTREPKMEPALRQAADQLATPS